MFKRKNPTDLQAQLQNLKGGSAYAKNDETEWKLKLDAAKNGQAVIRFLPGKGDEGLPFIKLVNHGFKKNNQWYIANCTSTHGDFDSCPVCQYLKEHNLYETNFDEYSNLKRKTSYWANILVIKDPANPETEGKVFKFRFGQKIMDKINAMVEVDESMGEVPVDVTCPFDGANFVIKVKQVGGFTNYDESKFMKQSEIANIEDEAYQAELEEGMTDLSALIAKDQFESYEKNNERFVKVMGTAAMGGAASKAAAAADSFEKELQDFDAGTFDSDEDDLADVMGGTTTTGSSDDDLDDLLNDLP